MLSLTVSAKLSQRRDTLGRYEINNKRPRLLRRGDLTSLLENLETRCLLSATFSSAQTYPTGGNPIAITTGDFRHDGKIDVAAVDYVNGGVSVLLNNGDGTLTSPNNFSTGNAPYAIVAADFNADGFLDLAVTNSGNSTVSVLINTADGTGTFNAHVDYPTGSGAGGIAAGDFNDDGKVDLAVTDNLSNTISVLLNNGNGTFASKVDYITDAVPYAITTGDFNGDAHVDLAVANNTGNTVNIFLNKGDSTGTFNAKADYTTGNNPIAIVAGKFNGDNKDDLAVANHADNTLSVLINNGDGTFAGKVDYATGSMPSAVAAGAVSGSAIQFLAVTNSGSSTVSVLANNGAGVLGAKTDYTTGTDPDAVVVADLNADNRLDIVAGDFTPNSISVLLQSATPVARYRLYNADTKEHLYTTDLNEYNTLPASGWTQEGTPYMIYDNPTTIGGVAALPYYRLYNPSTLQHLWTTDANEKNTLSSGLGWNYERVDGYIFASQVSGSQALYRLYLPYNGVALHLWTTDVNEYNTLAARDSWSQEGLIGYVITNNAV